MEPLTYLLIAAFAALTYVLHRSKHQRHLGTFFMIRSKFGIRLIDRVSKANPVFWNFIADFSVLLSFGGVGGYYLLSHKKSARSFEKAYVLLGVLFSLTLFYLGRNFQAAALVAATALGALFNRRFSSNVSGFFSTALIFSTASSLLISTLEQFKLEVFLSSIALGMFGLPAIMVYALLSHGLSILSSETELPGVSPMLPTSRGGNLGIVFPGYDIFIPWWHALTALFVTLVVHEGAHGILVRCSNIKLKSTGILTAFAMPIGAFVEPDEAQLEKKPSVDKMRVFTMGSFANVVTGVSASLLLAFFLVASQSTLYSDGLLVVGFIEGLPAEKVMEENTVIYSLNGVRTANYSQYADISDTLKPGELAVLNTSEGQYEITLGESESNPDKGFVGVYLVDNMKLKPKYAGVLSMSLYGFIYQMLKWVIFFNINIALVNLLPVIPFDGGRMFKEIVETLRISEEGVNKIVFAVVGFTAILFLVNMIPLFSMMFDWVYMSFFDI